VSTLLDLLEQQWNEAAQQGMPAYLAIPQTAIQLWSDPNLDPRYWWVDPGRLPIRMGPDAFAIAASSHDACKAAVTILSMSSYVDLSGSELASILDTLIAAGQPAANPIFPGSGPMTAAKKAAICSKPTTDQERYVKGLPQPLVGVLPD